MAEEECVGQLRGWLESQGARLGSLRIAAAQDGPTAAEERGVYATQKIKVDEVIAEVPQSCVLSAERARESPVGKAFLKTFPEDTARDKWVFLLDLLAARVDATHPAHVYLAALPRESPTPMSWPANLRAMLAGTNLGAAVDEEREQLESQFAAMMPKLRAAHPELFSEHFTLENFLWAHGMWFSRRYPTAMASFDKGQDYSWQRRAEEDLEEESDGEGALVPFMDFTNHRSGTKIVWRASAEKISFLSGEGVEGGAEVFNNYGDKSNEDLMLIHGFALLDNIHDTYGLWLTVQVSDQPPGGRKRRRALRTERIGPFHLRRKDARWKQFPEDLWQALSANAGNEHLKALGGLLRQRLQVLFHQYFPIVFKDRAMVSSCNFLISLALAVACFYSAGYRKGVPKLLVQTWSEADSLRATTATAASTAPAMARPATLPYAPPVPVTKGPKAKRVKDYAICVYGAVRAMMMHEVMDLWFKNVVNVTMHSPNGADFFYHLFVGTELSQRGQSGLSKADAQDLSSALEYATQFQLQYTENHFTCDTMATGRFFKLAECAKMIRRYQERENLSYNFIIFTRPDLMFPTPAPDLKLCEKPSGGRWYMGMLKGVEADLFAISGDALDVVERAVQAESWAG
eukprot:s204_g1.t1